MHRLRTIIGIIAVLTSLFANAQEISNEKLAVAFVFGTIHPRKPDGTPIRDSSGKPVTTLDAPLGTAFFVLYPDSRGGPDFGFMYLVTAKHVLRDSDGTFLKEIKLRIDLKKPENGNQLEFIEHIPVSDDGRTLHWFTDNDNAVDVAALPILPSFDRYNYKAIPLKMFVDDELLKTQQVAEGDSLYFIGLMAQYYGEKRNYPVVRRGTLALMTDEKIDTPTGMQRAFIAELASWPGNSGSPVFLSLGGMRQGSLKIGLDLHFLGILSGSFQNRIKATVPDATTVIGGNELNTGISFIVPAAQVKRVLDSPAAQQERDIQIKRLPATK